MYKRIAKLVGSLTLLMAVLTGVAQASVQVIGTADINGTGTGYNLIYDTGGDGWSPLVWLDYTQAVDTWTNQVSWVSGLNNISGLGSVTYYLNPGISMNWGGSWRLPATIDSLVNAYVYSPTNAEMAHLFYTSLGTPVGGGGYSMNTGPFTKLVTNAFPMRYWSSTEYAPITGYAYYFDNLFGWEGSMPKDGSDYALAVRSGQLVVVPEPSAYFLLGIGLGVVGYARRKMCTR